LRSGIGIGRDGELAGDDCVEDEAEVVASPDDDSSSSDKLNATAIFSLSLFQFFYQKIFFQFIFISAPKTLREFFDFCCSQKHV
jgi:hypothetical protein